MQARKTSVILLTAFVMSVAFVFMLYFSSESKMKNENPFIRRIPPLTATKSAGYYLGGNRYYFAGTASGKIYLGNHAAPLYITEIDTMLHKAVERKIELDRYDFPFRSVEVRVADPYLFVYDGMVPVIYRGLLSELKASVVMEDPIYFTGAAVLGGDKMVIRGQKPPKGENILGLLDLNGKPKAAFNKSLLQKQLDGIFDTDGKLTYDPGSGWLVYTYFYRNEFIVMNNSLKLSYRGNTIDTTTTAKLKIVTIEKSGDTKLEAPPVTVNRRSEIEGNLLFIHSLLRGQHESDKVWKAASAIDVYNLKSNTYLSSFYIYNDREEKLKEFMVTPTAVYAIVGSSLHKYDLGKTIRNQMD